MRSTTAHARPITARRTAAATSASALLLAVSLRGGVRCGLGGTVFLDGGAKGAVAVAGGWRSRRYASRMSFACAARPGSSASHAIFSSAMACVRVVASVWRQPAAPAAEANSESDHVSDALDGAGIVTSVTSVVTTRASGASLLSTIAVLLLFMYFLF